MHQHAASESKPYPVVFKQNLYTPILRARSYASAKKSIAMIASNAPSQKTSFVSNHTRAAV